MNISTISMAIFHSKLLVITRPGTIDTSTACCISVRATCWGLGTKADSCVTMKARAACERRNAGKQWENGHQPWMQRGTQKYWRLIYIIYIYIIICMYIYIQFPEIMWIWICFLAEWTWKSWNCWAFLSPNHCDCHFRAAPRWTLALW